MEASHVQSGVYNSVQDGVSTSYLPSVAPLQGLKQLYLHNLIRDTHHRGRYVLLKTIGPTQVILTDTVVYVHMEDAIGEIALVQFQHRIGNHHLHVESAPGDRVCIIKEPYFRPLINGNYGLGVDHMSDFNWLPKLDVRIPQKWKPRSLESAMTATQLKDSGNEALKSGKLLTAIEFYNAALQKASTPGETRVIKLNRSLAHLKIGCYDQALEDASEDSASAMNTEKGLYRAARALYELGRFQESEQVFTTLLEAYPGCEAAKKELCLTEKRFREQKFGLYDYSLMDEVATEKVPPRLDTATYEDPVTIKMTEGRGRGLFTTRDVAAGDLLLCEKAFSYSYFDYTPTAASNKGREIEGTPEDLVASTLDQLSRTPSKIPSVTSLYHGTYETVKEKTVDGTPIVDTFMIDRIVSLNAFLNTRETMLTRLDRVGIPKAERAKPDRSCGIYIKASHVNHSCYSNARRSFIGDVLILRAARNIKAGEEVLFWYTAPNANDGYEKTQEGLRPWGFRCSCQICTYRRESSDKQKKKRAALWTEFVHAGRYIKGEAGLTEREKRLAAIEQTYTVPATLVPRLDLWDSYLDLARVYACLKDPERTIAAVCKVVAALGFVVKQDASSFKVEQWGLMVDDLIETWAHLWMAYERMVSRRPELCKKAEEYTRTTYRICVGEDDTLEEQVGSVVRRAIRNGCELSVELGLGSIAK